MQRSHPLTRRAWLQAAASMCCLSPWVDGWARAPARAPLARTVPPAYRRIAAAQRVPAALLFAIALQESRHAPPAPHAARGALPWPWTLNVRGEARRFPDRISAQHDLERWLRQDVRLVDVGLMQVNWRYHAPRLGSPARALEPYWNLSVGAAILREHYLACGDWGHAVGRYHHPAGGAPAVRYARAVSRQLEGLLDG